MTKKNNITPDQLIELDFWLQASSHFWHSKEGCRMAGLLRSWKAYKWIGGPVDLYLIHICRGPSHRYSIDIFKDGDNIGSWTQEELSIDRLELLVREYTGVNFINEEE